MTALLIDCGNTRLKWCSAESGVLSAINSAFYEAPEDMARRIVEAKSMGNVSRCLFASVKSESFNSDLASAIEELADVSVESVFVQHRESLKLAYRDVSQMGVDRYLNLLGAQALGLESALVVSGGTAVTFDAYRCGEHLGGAIFPGFGLLGRVLSRDTGKIKEVVDPSLDDLFARSTREAISAGVINGYAGAVAHIVAQMKTGLPADAPLILTGGDADRVSSALNFPNTVEPDLLFRGMAGLLES